MTYIAEGLFTKRVDIDTTAIRQFGTAQYANIPILENAPEGTVIREVAVLQRDKPVAPYMTTFRMYVGWKAPWTQFINHPTMDQVYSWNAVRRMQPDLAGLGFNGADAIIGPGSHPLNVRFSCDGSAMRDTTAVNVSVWVKYEQLP